MQITGDKEAALTGEEQQRLEDFVYDVGAKMAENALNAGDAFDFLLAAGYTLEEIKGRVEGRWDG